MSSSSSSYEYEYVDDTEGSSSYEYVSEYVSQTISGEPDLAGASSVSDETLLRAKLESNVVGDDEVAVVVSDDGTEKRGVAVVKKDWIDDAVSADESSLEELARVAASLRKKYGKHAKPASWTVSAVAWWWGVLGAAAVAASVWYVLPYDTPYVETKEGRDENLSWAVGIFGIVTGLAMMAVTAAAVCSSCNASPRGATWFVRALSLSLVAMLLANAGVYYIYYSDSELSQDAIRKESGIVPLIGLGILLFFMAPCVCIGRSYASDYAAYDEWRNNGYEYEYVADSTY